MTEQDRLMQKAQFIEIRVGKYYSRIAFHRRTFKIARRILECYLKAAMKEAA